VSRCVAGPRTSCFQAATTLSSKVARELTTELAEAARPLIAASRVKGRQSAGR
jgi:hypothetical protein